MDPRRRFKPATFKPMVPDVPPVQDARDREHLIEELALRAIADARTHGIEPASVVRSIQKIIKRKGD